MDPEEFKAKFNGLAAVSQNFGYGAAEPRFHFIHHFHRFDDADHGSRLNAIPYLDKGGLVGAWRALESAHHGGSDKST